MNHPVVRFMLVFWLAAGLAFAQEALTPLELYESATGHLENSLRTLSDNPADSEASLGLAADAFRLLSQQTRSGSLREGVTDTFAQARTAVLRRSATDLEVRLAIIRGGLHRVLYEIALYEAAAAPEQAQAYAARLARDLNLSAERQEALAEISSWRQLQAELEAGIGERALAELEGLLAVAESDRDAATIRLARAYGLFIPVQDSTRTSVNTTDAFVEAFAALFEGDQAALTGSLAVLETQMARLAEADAAPEPNATPGSNGNGTTVVAASEVATAETADAAPADAAAEVELVTPVIFSAAPAEVFAQAAPVPASEAPAGPDVTSPGLEAGVAEEAEVSEAAEISEVAEAAAPQAPETPAAYELELASYNLPAATLQRLQANFAASDYASVAEVVAALQARSARLVAASQHGQIADARQHLSAIRSEYALFLQPLLEPRDGALATSTLNLLRHLENAPELRLQDAVTVNGQLEVVRGALSGQPPTMLQGIDSMTATLWPGWARAAVLAILALFAFVPLRLLNLAFGGGNRNWRWISMALFLLLLPLIYEGVVSVALLVAEFGMLPELYLAASLSPFSSLTAQAVWAAIMLLAILFATIGLRGICAQFGLIGKPKVTAQGGLQAASKAPSVKQTIEEPFPAQRPQARVASKSGPSNAIDWDDD